ncbi:flagellar basal body P-ring formation chaperone FlgA [Gilvimarinus sp. DA14]|uniref:flagellar basal body P-ring formation chaperone FlgA n=1 Tax=Gilvimarinus sp. DA14 TaxID=2956798 RepID=UPI0020B6AD89|nr:flagellar basal body P-ring formation chaperone FlgA [Gilvimarinus sp. DA14]UTF60821.1 flagellar basal body P-ring formation chaperone FlgA [Gilvimarinus sp. DA14]
MTLVRNFCAIILLVVTAGSVKSLQAAEHHDLSALLKQAHNYLQRHYGEHSERVEIDVAALDRRLKLANCSQPIDFEVRDLTGDGGSVSVLARCDGQAPWKIYLGAQVDIYRQILVARRGMGRQEVISQSDLEIVMMPGSDLRSGYFTDNQRLIGKQLKRPIEAGEPFRPALVEEPLAINRGDVVTLESGSGAISVATQAEALSSGRIGEQIRVRNLSSERIIRAHIVSQGRVAANF